MAAPNATGHDDRAYQVDHQLVLFLYLAAQVDCRLVSGACRAQTYLTPDQVDRAAEFWTPEFGVQSPIWKRMQREDH